MTPEVQAAAPGRLRRFAGWYRRHAWTLTLGLVFLVVLSGFAAVQVAMHGRVGDGVTVAGVSLQGQSAAQARATLARELAPRVDAVRLQRAGSAPVSFTLGTLGMKLDTAATVRAALAAGRHRLPLGVSVWLPGSGAVLAPALDVSAGAYDAALEAVRKQVDVPARDARLTVRGGVVDVVPSAAGSTVDALALERAIRASVAAGRSYSGPLPLKAVPPQVSTAVAQSRAAAAASYLSRPVTLRYRGTSVVLGPAQMAAMLSVNTGADASEYPLTFRNDRARAALHRLLAAAEVKPVDARLVVHSDGSVTITPSREGQVLDMAVLLGDLDAAVTGGGLRSVFVAVQPAVPALTAGALAADGFASQGSQFVTYFDPRNTTRVKNIALAAGIVDGTVVRPGATFSLNAALGPRTTNRGFDYAPVIAADNVLRQGVGGGICQYATTLFNAVFFAGLPVVERHAHSLYISHYPIGRDATVSWGSADFRFRNDTARPLTIRSWVQGDHVTVAIIGRTGRKVTYVTGAFYDVRKPAYGKAHPRVIYDSDLGRGLVRWQQGIDGRSIRVERTVRSAAGALLFRDAFVSHYAPMDWVKRVGT